MKHYLFLVFLLISLCGTAQTIMEVPQASQKAVTSQTIGLTEITVEYFRPSVKGRKIWGELVPYGFTSETFDGKDQAPWKTGANMNTTLSFTHDVMIEGKPVKAGKYGFFAAIHENGTATLVLSKTNSAYGHYFYKQEEDILRVDVKTKTALHTELLTFSFDEVSQNATTLSLKWETKEIPVHLEVNVPEIVTASLIEQMKHPRAFSWHSRVQAVRYLLDNHVHLDLAYQWAQEAVNGSPGDELMEGDKNFVTLVTLSHVLFALDSAARSKAVLKEALSTSSEATIARAYSVGRNLQTKKRYDDAHLVFNWMIRQWPDAWEGLHGKAKLLSAEGKFKEALKFENLAFLKAPADQQKTLQEFIQRLQNNKDIN